MSSNLSSLRTRRAAAFVFTLCLPGSRAVDDNEHTRLYRQYQQHLGEQ